MIQELAGAIIGTAVTAGYLAFGFAIHHYRAKYRQQQDTYTQLLDRALASEARRVKAETEHDYLKTYVVTINQQFDSMLKRPVIATLSEQQANGLMQGIVAYINSQTKNLPN